MDYKLPVLKILTQAFVVPWELRVELIKKLSVPILFLIGIGYVEEYSNGIYDYLFAFIGYLAYVFLAVTCHRIIILGKNSVPTFGVRKWTMREARFFSWLVGLYIMIGVMIFSIAALPSVIIPLFEGRVMYLVIPVSIISALPGVYVLSRLSLIFPATSVDEKANIKWAWDISRNNGWRLAVIVCALPAAAGYIQNVLIGEDDGVLKSTLLMLVAFVVLIIEIAALSLTYKELKNET